MLQGLLSNVEDLGGGTNPGHSSYPNCRAPALPRMVTFLELLGIVPSIR